eukprot:TRINITY_DN4266_c0_g1_i1.p1 TRINITY_DN4266_c0_g1~~TRINITY_DN4266_c0_g1_i1.p1  ORF type:complete len:396 (+),score=93.52 TRINITY_DN4266_c0_g1_i1:198-1385(+)
MASSAEEERGFPFVPVTPKEEDLKERISKMWSEKIAKLPGHEDKEGQRVSLNRELELLPVSLFRMPSRRKVVEIQSDASILEAMATLSENQILCAPVRNVGAADDSSWLDRYIGMVDFAGIALWLLGAGAKQSNGSMGRNCRELKNTKVSSITGSFRWAPFLPVSPDDSMLTVLLLLSKYRMKAVPVVESGESKVRQMITQSSAVQFLAECEGMCWFDELGRKSLREMGLPTMSPEKVVLVEEDSCVWDAFAMMVKRHIGGMPVVKGGAGRGSSREVVGSISVRDIRFLLSSSLDVLPERQAMTVGSFLEMLSSTKCGGRAVLCQASDSLASVLQQLSASHAHRGYTVSEQAGLEGVVTLRDVIGCLLIEPPNYFGDFFGGVVPDVHPVAHEPAW